MTADQRLVYPFFEEQQTLAENIYYPSGDIRLGGKNHGTARKGWETASRDIDIRHPVWLL